MRAIVTRDGNGAWSWHAGPTAYGHGFESSEEAAAMARLLGADLVVTAMGEAIPVAPPPRPDPRHGPPPPTGHAGAASASATAAGPEG